MPTETEGDPDAKAMSNLEFVDLVPKHFNLNPNHFKRFNEYECND